MSTATKKWIFVSHASSDIKQVRKVRNYLERKGASPLLFHLLSLNNPEEFWPVIEQEIAARNFFLYCDSKKARDREWVRKERAAVQKAAKSRPIRIGKVSVEGRKLDKQSLDEFLAVLRVFPTYSRQDFHLVHPFIDALDAAGFLVSKKINIAFGREWRDAVGLEIRNVAKEGWVLLFLTHRTYNSSWVAVELQHAREARARIVPVLLEETGEPWQHPDVQTLDATAEPESAPQRLVKELLQRRI